VVLARVAAVLVDLGDADLHAGVVLGLDDAAGRAALAGDVTKPGEKEKNTLADVVKVVYVKCRCICCVVEFEDVFFAMGLRRWIVDVSREGSRGNFVRTGRRVHRVRSPCLMMCWI